MKKKTNKLKSVFMVIALFALVLLPISVGAKNTNAEQGQSNGGTSGNTDSGSGSGNSNSDSGNGSVIATQTKLQGKNLESCQNRETVMNNIMARIGDRGQKQIDVVDSIDEKVQAFYVKKNISIENYDTLKKNVEDKKTLALAAMNNVRNINGNFDCKGDNPKGIATQFKSQASAQSEAINNYRNAVHDLVVAIKTALNSSEPATEEN